jgi:protein ImuB
VERSEPDRRLPKAKAENVQRRTPNPQRPIADILAILHKWGIHTLGQLAALDREDLRARLGPLAVSLWERATGQANRLLKFVQPPECFEENFEFEHEIETAEPLLFMLRRFLEQLALRLNALYLVARELTLRITFSNPSPDRSGGPNNEIYQHTFKIPQPTNDVDLLFRMLQTHLENFRSEHPILGVSLTAEPIKPVSQQFGLFETALRNPQQLYETLARLTALLGSERVGTPVLEETHRPDAFRMERFTWNSEPEGQLAAATEEKMDVHHRTALRRFRPATAASIFSSKHRHLQSEKTCGKIVDQSGPYFLSGNWWDEKFWNRAEWDLELEGGGLCRAHETDGVWKVDGIYD